MDPGVPFPSWRTRGVWLLLGAWLGALVLFATVVAPAAFAVAPSREVAGNLVGRVLVALDYTGAVAGVALAGLALALGRTGGAIALPLLASVLCLVSRWVVTPRIAALRPLVRDPGADPALRAEFGMLHGVSVGLAAAVLLTLALLVLLHARSERGAKKKAQIS